jgi:hypothetical protein
MRRLLLAACLALAACGGNARSGGNGEFSDLVACIPPAAGAPGPSTVAAMVDRADLIALVSVEKAERTYSGYFDAQGARRLTLKTVENAKGTTPASFTVDDGRCPMLVGQQGETFVAFLVSASTGYKPMGQPRSAIRATPDHTLAQYMSDIHTIRPLDGDARAVFQQYGWIVTGKLDVGELTLPPLAEWSFAGREIRGAAPYLPGPLERIAALSGEVGLDPRPSAGKAAERLSFWLENAPPEFREGTPFGHVLIVERKIVGAWVTVAVGAGQSVFSVRDRPAALSAKSPAPFPPANRAPQGANIAQLYGLANARSIAYKTGTGGNGELTDATKIRAIAASLDVTLPATQATWPRQQPPTMYWLHFSFADSTVSLEYDSATAVISVVNDGFAVKAPAAFATLVAEIH